MFYFFSAEKSVLFCNWNTLSDFGLLFLIEALIKLLLRKMQKKLFDVRLVNCSTVIFVNPVNLQIMSTLGVKLSQPGPSWSPDSADLLDLQRCN